MENLLKGVGYGIGASVFAMSVFVLTIVTYTLGQEQKDEEYDRSYQTAIKSLSIRIHDNKLNRAADTEKEGA